MKDWRKRWIFFVYFLIGKKRNSFCLDKLSSSSPPFVLLDVNNTTHNNTTTTTKLSEMELQLYLFYSFSHLDYNVNYLVWLASKRRIKRDKHFV